MIRFKKKEQEDLIKPHTRCERKKLMNSFDEMHNSIMESLNLLLSDKLESK